MFRKFVLGAAASFMLVTGAMAAEVIVKIAPPRMIVEKRPSRPSPNHVWVNGYHRWDGNAYAWTPGEWRERPHAHAVWVDHRWEHRNGGYVFVEGHWK